MTTGVPNEQPTWEPEAEVDVLQEVSNCIRELTNGGSSGACWDLVVQVAARTRRQAGIWGIPAADLDEVVQNTIQKIVRALPRTTFAGSGRFWSWCQVLFTRCALDYLRRKGRRESRFVPLQDYSETLVAPADPRQEAEAKDEAQILNKVMAELDPKCRNLLQLYHFEELSYGMIAHSIGTTAEAVRSTIRRCHGRALDHYEAFTIA